MVIIMNQCDHLKPSETGLSLVVRRGGSVHEMRLFVDKVMKLMATKLGLFLDVNGQMTVPARKKVLRFLDYARNDIDQITC